MCEWLDYYCSCMQAELLLSRLLLTSLLLLSAVHGLAAASHPGFCPLVCLDGVLLQSHGRSSYLLHEGLRLSWMRTCWHAHALCSHSRHAGSSRPFPLPLALSSHEAALGRLLPAGWSSAAPTTRCPACPTASLSLSSARSPRKWEGVCVRGKGRRRARELLVGDCGYFEHFCFVVEAGSARL